jgi:hypothetical protein
MWSGAPGGQGWAPNIFVSNDPSNNSDINEPHLRGSIMVRRRIRCEQYKIHSSVQPNHTYNSHYGAIGVTMLQPSLKSITLLLAVWLPWD